MAFDPELRAHQDWLGFVQPVGLLVSPVALQEGQASVTKIDAATQDDFLEWVDDLTVGDDETASGIRDLKGLATSFLRWDADDIVPQESIPETLQVPLPEYGEILAPTFAVRDSKAEGRPWILLVQDLPAGTRLDEPAKSDGPGWIASPEARFERLLRETNVPIGLLSNRSHLRLVYAPVGESSGHATFNVAHMSEVAGRPILGALHMLLDEQRLFVLDPKRRLPALLESSRRFQARVSTVLSKQVLEALYELLRGLQAADARRNGELLRLVLRENPDHVYEGLLTVLLRLVFLLYAEDRGLLPGDAVFREHYSIGALYVQLRADADRFPDTMDSRFGAWARLLSLFRIVHDGARHGSFQLPERQGGLFDPDRFNFLEGRPWTVRRSKGEREDPPMISDGVVYRVLDKLLLLNGERLSYRTLDVEQIGSVYETMMGFTIQTATGPSIALKPKKPHGAPAVVNLEELLAVPADKRSKWLRERADQELSGEALKSFEAAKTTNELEAALAKKIAREATRSAVPRGLMVLQPSAARRKSGSHYTPRSLTSQVVRKALEPILRELGPNPRPEAILALKVCDLAMGSGAFLVEVCRQLADALVRAWHAHKSAPPIPADEDEVLHARRLVAQRCLYGVDKNPMAVDLAKLSLWLATLAKEHPFTFLDHALRHGDTLVGLTRQQIANLHWLEKGKTVQQVIDPKVVQLAVEKALTLRARIQDEGETLPYHERRLILKAADEALDDVRMIGDLAVAAYLERGTSKSREELRSQVAESVRRFLADRSTFNELRSRAEDLRRMAKPVPPFHWEIEFPEVFRGPHPGFDAIVGNPPFAGKNSMIEAHADEYPAWLKQIHAESHGNADLVAHFFRRAFGLVREGGTFGLIATKTIRHGDTRSTGLRWICTHGGTIYAARTRLKWPGVAAVVVSLVHARRGAVQGPYELDGKAVPLITAYLFHAGGHEDPAKLLENEGKSFQGSIVLGMGFTFDDTDKKGVASPIAEMHRLVAKDPRNQERIFPYIGGEEVNDSPTHAHHRYVINFGEMTEEEARQWPDLMRIVEERVKPLRLEDNRESYRRNWWQYAEKRADLYVTIRGLDGVLACARHQPNWTIAGMPTGGVFSEALVVFAIPGLAAFTLLQSRVHEAWARFFGSSMKDDLRYTPSDCFETFPFPESWQNRHELIDSGKRYYDLRARIMRETSAGLTETYNAFNLRHGTSDDILELRKLHDAMDRAVLDAYEWTDLKITCDVFLDYDEDDEDDAEDEPRKKQPWRYRWPDEFRDEVLARLLLLNRDRARAEQVAGMAPSVTKRRSKAPSASRKPTQARVSPRSPTSLPFET